MSVRPHPDLPNPIALAVIIVAMALGILLTPGEGRAAIPNVDWNALPAEPQRAPDGFTVFACEGDGPLLCTEESGQPQGLLEHTTHAVDTLAELNDDLAAGMTRTQALIAEVQRHRRIIRADREEVCPTGYRFLADPTVGAVVAGTNGVRFGFSVLGEGGNLVERSLAFMGIRDTADGPILSVIAASELNEGACVNAEDTLPFTSGALGRFAPTMAEIVAGADLGEGSQPRPVVTADRHAQADDAIATAIEASRLAVPHDGGADAVLIARDDVFADALAAGTAQGIVDAPLLLTDSDALDPRVSAEIRRVGATQAVVLGGRAAITPAVTEALSLEGLTVTRIAGADRIGTALAIAEAYAPLAERVVLARAFGRDDAPSAAYADALAAGALAADQSVPLLLTAGDAMDDRVIDWLAGRGVDQVAIVGGDQAIAQPVRQRLVEEGYGLLVLAGADRAETAVRVNVDRSLPTADHPGSVILADAGGWVDGLTVTLLAHRTGSPILLADGEGLPAATQAFLATANPADPPRLICMPGVTADACAAARNLLTER